QLKGRLFKLQRQAAAIYGGVCLGCRTAATIKGVFVSFGQPGQPLGGCLFGAAKVGSHRRGRLFGAAKVGSHCRGRLFGAAKVGSHRRGRLFGAAKVGSQVGGVCLVLPRHAAA
nr:hypothetical protein [Tanacetum cinerariifolium]